MVEAAIGVAFLSLRGSVPADRGSVPHRRGSVPRAMPGALLVKPLRGAVRPLPSFYLSLTQDRM
jgi:hypothetical protein